MSGRGASPLRTLALCAILIAAGPSVRGIAQEKDPSAPPAPAGAALLRETLRSRIDALGPPDEIRPRWNGAPEEVRRTFDLSEVPETEREAAVSVLAEKARRLMEAAWIEGEVLKLPPEAHPLSGDYECVEGPRCHESGTFMELQPDPYGGITVTAVYSPYVVEVSGATMQIRRSTSTTTPHRHLDYTTACETCERYPMPWSHSDSVASAEMICRIAWDGRQGEGVCESRAKTTSQIITNQHGGTTIPGLDVLSIAPATVRLTSPGRLALERDGATTILEKKP